MKNNTKENPWANFEGRRVAARKNKRRDHLALIISGVITWAMWLTIILVWMPNAIPADGWNDQVPFSLMIVITLFCIVIHGLLAIFIRNFMRNPEKSRI